MGPHRILTEAGETVEPGAGRMQLAQNTDTIFPSFGRHPKE